MAIQNPRVAVQDPVAALSAFPKSSPTRNIKPAAKSTQHFNSSYLHGETNSGYGLAYDKNGKRRTTSTSVYGGGGRVDNHKSPKTHIKTGKNAPAYNQGIVGTSSKNTNNKNYEASSDYVGGNSGSGGGYSGGGSSSGGSSGSGKTAKAKTGLAVVKGSSTAGLAIGLNANKIVAIEAALDAYIKSVISAIHVAAKQKNVALAIKGAAAQVEVRKYIASMDSACEKLFKDLEKYKKILEQMKSNYASNDKFNNSASVVSGSSHPNIASVGFTLNK